MGNDIKLTTNDIENPEKKEGFFPEWRQQMRNSICSFINNSSISIKLDGWPAAASIGAVSIVAIIAIVKKR